MKILYIGVNNTKVVGGADIVNNQNISFLKNIFRDNLHFYFLNNENTFKDKIQGYIGKLTPKDLALIINKINTDKFNYVFISHSAIGRLASKIKYKVKHPIKIITFFHNIEKHYASEYLKVNGFKGFPFFWAVSYNEVRAVKNSDIKIVLNERDSQLMFKTYNKKAECILPVSYADTFNKSRSIKTNNSVKEFLFVGSAFFANIEGIKWFINNVLKHIDAKLIIVGNGMDEALYGLNNSKVEVHGYVDNLGDYYYRENIIIAPIFSGGGMKTKIAEALMYGKKIIGTKEAFQGYNKDNDVFVECNSSEEFINCINNLDEQYFFQNSRIIFTENYSYDAVFHNFKKLFKDL
ncbi:glycosyltransferase family 4 protein [Empedobacter sp.]|uniref:glycosyltransferase n=1 Tax=Empedobacter sp. TaxID=1927715 RepID=UPI0028A1E985|nr:glycosyltransferase family 4 protein [Empedobacter sp.]